MWTAIIILLLAVGIYFGIKSTNKKTTKDTPGGGIEGGKDKSKNTR